MVRPRVTRAVNPQRKLSAAQIRAGFGGKRRRNSLKASKRHAHARPKAKSANPKKKRRRAKAKSANPRTKVVYRTKTKIKRVYVKAKAKANPRPKKNRRKAKAKRRNPGQYLMTMSPVGNPQRKRKRSTKSMAKTRRRAHAKSNSGRKNPTRRRRVARKTNHKHSTRRNPFGQSTMSLVKKGAGVFVGFSIGKNVPPMLGTTANSSPGMTLLTTIITGGIAAWAAKKFAPADFAEGVLWGAAGAVVNMGWNTWAPTFITGFTGPYLGVSGLRDFVPGGFPLPQVPVRRMVAAAPAATPAMPAGSGANMGAWGRSW